MTGIHDEARERERKARAASGVIYTDTVHEVRVTLNDVDLAAIALGLGETSTQAQRALAREALGSLIRQAMEAITECIVGYERPTGGETCAACGEVMTREVIDVSGFGRTGRWVCPVHG